MREYIRVYTLELKLINKGLICEYLLENNAIIISIYSIYSMFRNDAIVVTSAKCDQCFKYDDKKHT